LRFLFTNYAVSQCWFDATSLQAEACADDAQTPDSLFGDEKDGNLSEV